MIARLSSRGEVGAITRDAIAANIDRALGEVDFEVDFTARAGLTIDLAAVGGGAVSMGSEGVGVGSAEISTRREEAARSAS